MAWQYSSHKDARDEVKSLGKDHLAYLAHIRNLVESQGQAALKMPYVRPMGDGLYEFRLNGKDTIARVLFCYHGKERIVFLAAFIKKTQKTPQRYLELARKRMKEIKDG